MFIIRAKMKVLSLGSRTKVKVMYYHFTVHFFKLIIIKCARYALVGLMYRFRMFRYGIIPG